MTLSDSGTADSGAMDLDAADPVTASYRVFLNPALPLGRRLLVLQHPTRTDDAPRPPPAELRLKPHAGMVEADVPLDTAAAYDRDKGLRWGRALDASAAARNGGAHGLAGGFGFGAVPHRAPRKRPDDAAAAGLDWSDAVRQDKVLRTQTLGGQHPAADEVQHMVGVFHGRDLHLTPVASLVHLRPQLHHLDAAAQQDRSAASAASKDAAAAPAPAARAIHMTIKATADGDAVTTETMADRLRCVQTEPWRRLRYTDENDEAAWDVYNDSLFLKPPATSAAADDHAAAAAAEPPDLEGRVPRFAARWGDKQLLEAVSGITKPDPEPELAPDPADKQPPEPAPSRDADADEARKPKGRPRGGGAAAASRRGGRAKASKAAASTVDID